VATTVTENGHKQNTETSNINQKDEGTWDDRGRDGGTDFISRIKEQETGLTLHEHDGGDDDDDDEQSRPILFKNDSFLHPVTVGQMYLLV